MGKKPKVTSLSYGWLGAGLVMFLFEPSFYSTIPHSLTSHRIQQPVPGIPGDAAPVANRRPTMSPASGATNRGAALGMSGNVGTRVGEELSGDFHKSGVFN